MSGRIDKRIIITLVATLSVTAVSVWLVVFLLGGKVRESFEDFQKEKLNSLVLEEKRDKILFIQREIPDLETRKRELESLLLNKNETVPLLRFLEKIADKNSCLIKIESADIKKIKFETEKVANKKEESEEDRSLSSEDKNATSEIKKEKKKEDFISQFKDYPVFLIEVNGKFSSIVDFLSDLENIPYFARPLIVDFSEGKPEALLLQKEESFSSEASFSENNQESTINVVKMSITLVAYGNW